MHELINQISRVAVVDDATLQGIQQEVLSLNEPWTRVYNDYHSGGWWTLSLLNNTSNPHDALIEDCVPKETSLLAKMPVTKAFLQNLGLKYMWVRLAKLEPNSFMWEHCDYQELQNVQRFRLHVPIITTPDSTLIINVAKIHLNAGYIWKLNPTHRHASGNLGSEARIHILMDCYLNEALENMLNAEDLDEACVVNLPVTSDSTLEHALDVCEGLARMGYHNVAEHHLLKMYHLYNLEQGRGYDLVSQMYESLQDQERQELWQSNKAIFLGRDRPEIVA
jgi:Aspartyl/Asparaginyl beta-hydroxylase